MGNHFSCSKRKLIVGEFDEKTDYEGSQLKFIEAELERNEHSMEDIDVKEKVQQSERCDNMLMYDPDVSFSFKNCDGKLLQANRLILSQRSQVFQTMFFGSLPDKRDTVDIVDIEYDVFELILRYIYTNKYTPDGDNVLHILYGARKYLLSGLTKACSSFLEKSLSCDNVCTIYEHAKMFNIDDLIQTCFAFMVQHSTDVCQSTDATCLSYESMREFLSCEDLNGDELDNFMLVNRWAEQQCVPHGRKPTPENKREILGDISSKICYQMIKPADFAKLVVPTNILPPEVQTSLLQYMITGEHSYIENYVFPYRNRHSFPIDTKHLGGLTYKKEVFLLKFCCNTNVRLVKLFPLTICGWEDFERKHISGITVRKKYSLKNTRVPVKTLGETGSIKKDIDVVFRANVTYTIRLKMRTRTYKQGPCLYAMRNSIATRKLRHTTSYGCFSCTIKRIPACVETVEFEVVR